MLAKARYRGGDDEVRNKVHANGHRVILALIMSFSLRK